MKRQGEFTAPLLVSFFILIPKQISQPGSLQESFAVSFEANYSTAPPDVHVLADALANVRWKYLNWAKISSAFHCSKLFCRFHYQKNIFEIMELNLKYQSCKSYSRTFDGWIILVHCYHLICKFGRTKWWLLEHRNILIAWLKFCKKHQIEPLRISLHGGGPYYNTKFIRVI